MTKTTYMALHQGRAYRTTRSRPANYAVFISNEYSLAVDKLLGWAKSLDGAGRMSRRASRSGRITIVNAKPEN